MSHDPAGIGADRTTAAKTCSPRLDNPPALPRVLPDSQEGRDEGYAIVWVDGKPCLYKDGWNV